MRGPMNAALSVLALGLVVTLAGSPAKALQPMAAESMTATQAVEADATAEPQADFAPEPETAVTPASEAVTAVATWVIASGDNRGLPFVIVDKIAAEVFVFRADGQLRGAGAALLGLARGDDSVPGIGDRPLSAIRPDERTTPAGRFLAGFGPPINRKRVLWVDYATAVSLHPVVTGNRREQRLQRLGSASSADNRITFGCINVSAAFYEQVVRPAFTGSKGVVYVLPETKRLADVFPALGPHQLANAALMGDPEDAADLGRAQ